MPDEELAPPREGSLQIIFFGADGLRAGWRVLISLALLTALFAVTVPLQKTVAHSLGTDFSAGNVIISECFTFAIVLLATFLMGRFEHRSIADYGLPIRQFLGRQFWTGALWGFLMLSLIVALMAVTNAYSPGGLALSASDVVKYGFLWAVGFLLVGLFEEFSFRGYLQYTLTMGIGFWPAAFLTCVLFAYAHHGNPGENWVGVIEIVLIALFLCMALRRTGNLWFAIGWHMAFDWAESFFYSTPNSGMHATGHMLNATFAGSKWLSGGSVGPEASVFDLLVTLAGILLLAKVYPDAKYPAPRPVTPIPAAPSPSLDSRIPFPADSDEIL